MADNRNPRSHHRADELGGRANSKDESGVPPTDADRIRWANELSAADRGIDERSARSDVRSEVDVTPTPVDERAPIVATPNAPPPSTPLDACRLDASTELSQEVPVPVAMSPAEVDQRAQIVDAMCEEPPKPPPRDSEADAEP